MSDRPPWQHEVIQATRRGWVWAVLPWVMFSTTALIFLLAIWTWSHQLALTGILSLVVTIVVSVALEGKGVIND